MSGHARFSPVLVLSAAVAGVSMADMPAITGTPVIDSPPALEWPADVAHAAPNITEPTANTLNDLHAGIVNCDLVLSTAGNYHMALRELWQLYLVRHGAELGNWFYTTSPPISFDQIANSNLQIGNFRSSCRPSVVVAPLKQLKRLAAADMLEGSLLPIYESRGMVLLVKKANPKNIKTVWDLGREGVRLATPNPTTGESIDNYAESIFNIAANDPSPPTGLDAAKLIDLLFNGKSGDPNKWLAGKRIHHREVPWSVAYGSADAGTLFYHLALDTVRKFPDKFEIVPLGGTVDDPQPTRGNLANAHYLSLVKGQWTPVQERARQRLVELYMSEDFTRILEKHGMRRPKDFPRPIGSSPSL